LSVDSGIRLVWVAKLGNVSMLTSWQRGNGPKGEEDPGAHPAALLQVEDRNLQHAEDLGVHDMADAGARKHPLAPNARSLTRLGMSAG
jgi:hypothetical protein